MAAEGASAPGASVSRYFDPSSRQPLCAVGAGGPGGEQDVQAAISVFYATIVEEMPRLLVLLWKSNRTHGLVVSSGTLAITVFDRSQLAEAVQLGLESGEGKLRGLELTMSAFGDPYISGGVAFLGARVIDAFDMGDATAFLCAVLEVIESPGRTAVTWSEARAELDERTLARYEERFEADRGWARTHMRWR